MAKQTVDVGSLSGDGTGDPLRSAFTKINDNFTELYGNIMSPVVPVQSVAGRTGNIVLNVSDVAGAASRGYVDTAIASNLSNYMGLTITQINNDITALQNTDANHESRIITLESDLSGAVNDINALTNSKASITYVDNSIESALGTATLLLDLGSVNANVAAANAQIANKAAISGQVFTGNITAPNVRVTSNITVDKTIFVGQPDPTDYPGLAARFIGNVDSYYQLVVQNVNSGPTASGDIVITADDGDDLSNYLNISVNSSNFAGNYIGSFGDTGLPTFPHDGYFTMYGGNAALASDHNTYIVANTAIVGLLKDGPFALLNTGLLFSDSTIQTTAYPNQFITSWLGNIDANVLAANVNISSLQSNAAAQEFRLDTLTANVAQKSIDIQLLTANSLASNLRIDTLEGVTSSQEATLNALYGNAGAQSTTLNSLVANAAAQALTLNYLLSNVASLSANSTVRDSDIATLLANAAVQAATLLALTANAASQTGDINALTANSATQGGQITSINANVAAANLRIQAIDANLGFTTNEIVSNLYLVANTVSNHAAYISTLYDGFQYMANVNGNNTFAGNVTAENLFANANAYIGTSVHTGILPPIDYPDLAGTFIGNVDSYYQLVVQNLNSGTNASGDIVITADDGDDETNYLNIGMNSSNFTGNFIGSFGDTGLPEFAHDGYFTVLGGNIALRTDGNLFLAANTKVVSLAQDGDFTLFNCNLTFSDGSIQTSASSPAFTMQIESDWDDPVTNIYDAINQLANRLRSAGY